MPQARLDKTLKDLQSATDTLQGSAVVINEAVQKSIIAYDHFLGESARLDKLEAEIDRLRKLRVKDIVVLEGNNFWIGLIIGCIIVGITSLLV